MTPGISNKKSQLGDQKYRNIEEIDTDYIIVGRSLYNSTDIEKTIKDFVY
jgi:orotidine-5'-phosphate decarboxylase